MAKNISVNALFYDTFLDLAKRCLDSLAASNYSDHVQDFRVALHVPSQELQAYVLDWAAKIAEKGTRVIVYEPEGNVFKYPTMRRMFFDEEHLLAQHVMWFDDDSYLTQGNTNFWADVSTRMETSNMLGQVWMLGPQGNQWDWMMTQPWFNKDLQKPKNFKFIQGAWWCMQRKILDEHNWPWPELQHNGGDSTLGEMLRHQGLALTRFDNGVRVNADDAGNHSRAPRKGVSQDVIARRYNGEPITLYHQEFQTHKTVFEGVPCNS